MKQEPRDTLEMGLTSSDAQISRPDAKFLETFAEAPADE